MGALAFGGCCWRCVAWVRKARRWKLALSPRKHPRVVIILTDLKRLGQEERCSLGMVHSNLWLCFQFTGCLQESITESRMLQMVASGYYGFGFSHCLTLPIHRSCLPEGCPNEPYSEQACLDLFAAGVSDDALRIITGLKLT